MADHGTLDVLLRAARVQLGISQAELAARAGVTRQAVSAIESGKAAPTMAVALRLARAVGRRVDDLFRLVDELPGVSAELLAPDDLPPEDVVRVQVANVDGRIIARPLAGAAGVVLTLPRANGIVRGASRPGQRAAPRSVRAELFVDPSRLQDTVVAVGCD